MPPFVGYILSRYFKDSFRKFCKRSIDELKGHEKGATLLLTLIAVNAATMAGDPKPCEIREKCVRCL